MPVDAALDLHGMRQHEAHPALHGFLIRAQHQSAKIVLVVTGKGEGRTEGRTGDIHEEGGVLRRNVPIWLRAPEWRNLVVGFEEAATPSRWALAHSMSASAVARGGRIDGGSGLGGPAAALR